MLLSPHRSPSPTGCNLELPLDYTSCQPVVARVVARQSLQEELARFREFGCPTRKVATVVASPSGGEFELPTYVNEFWTAKQRQASSLHEISYRACFKPQLPRFFIERLASPGERVYDPFMGRGTTPIEAALLGRIPLGNDLNPLSTVMTRPRLTPPTLKEIEDRLQTIPLDDPADCPEDLLAFYHPATLRCISSLKKYFSQRQQEGSCDLVDEWLAMVSLNRLTGHSNGFFSVYTLPPNQAVSPKSQRKINERRGQTPAARDVCKLILKKTRQLLGDVHPHTRQIVSGVASEALLLTRPADRTPEIASNSVSLIVTSPPFLNVVQYATDNWLRCWFLGIEAKEVKLTVPAKIEAWQAAMTPVFRELHRVLRLGGHVAFEVGEVHRGATKLEQAVVPCGLAVGLEPVLVLINDQKFTKTANCWGIDNMSKGTNTNRIVLFKKPA
jgi:hypothetical protein